MTFQVLRVDGRRRAINDEWTDWLSEADRFYTRYINEIETSPFDAHEVAAVGFLSASAARAGFLVFNEYQIIKKSQHDFRRKVPGRADLWLSRSSLTYSLEFKRAWYAATLSNLDKMMNVVRGDIRAIPNEECHYAMAGLIAYVRDEERESTYREFAKNQKIDMAYRIGPEGASGAYLYFSIKG